MSKQIIAASAIAALMLSSFAAASDSVKIIQPSKDSRAPEAAIGAGIGVGVSVGAAAAALSAAGIAAVPHAAGGMILISTTTGASYIAGTLGVIGGAAACVASVACAVAVAGGAAIAVGGGYYAYESLKSKEIGYDDVVMQDKEVFYRGYYYFRIKDKFVTPEKREELNNLAASDEFKSDRYLNDGILFAWGHVNDHYYVRRDIAQKLEAQFKSGGLYEVNADDQ